MSEQHKDNVIADLHEQVKGWRETAAEAQARVTELEGQVARLREAGDFLAKKADHVAGGHPAVMAAIAQWRSPSERSSDE